MDNRTGLLFDSVGDLHLGSAATNEVLRYGAASQAVFTVSLSSPSAVPVTVNYSTADGAALAGSDYTTENGTVVFDPGVTQRTIIVPTVDDALIESEETFVVNLSNPSAGATIGDPRGVATITDDDNPASPNDIYVWDIGFNSRTRGKGGLVHDEQIVVTVRRDSDADGVAEASDELVAGANVTVTLTGPVGGTYSGVTDSAGVFAGAWIKDVLDGAYMAEVTGLTHATFTYSGVLDPTANDSDSDGDGLPDDSHTIPHGAAAAASVDALDQLMAGLGGTTSSGVADDDSDPLTGSLQDDVAIDLLFG